MRQGRQRIPLCGVGVGRIGSGGGWEARVGKPTCGLCSRKAMTQSTTELEVSTPAPKMSPKVVRMCLSENRLESWSKLELLLFSFTLAWMSRSIRLETESLLNFSWVGEVRRQQ